MLRPYRVSEDKVSFQHDFKGVAGFGYVTRHSNPSKLWNNVIPLLPQQFMDVLTQGLPDNPDVTVEGVGYGYKELRVSITGNDDVYYSYCSIDTEYKKIKIEGIRTNLKGQGIGRTILRNYIELSSHLNIDQMELKACLDNGGYFWAKAGIPLKRKGANNNFSLVNSLGFRLKFLAQEMPQNIYNQTVELLKLNDLHDINAIADLSWVIPSNIIDILQATFENVVEEVLRIEENQEFFRERGLKYTLGQYLLNSANYEACLDFSDAQAMQRIEKYVGGFKTIELVRESEIDPASSVPFRANHLVAGKHAL